MSKVFKNKTEIFQKVVGISSLDYKERPKVIKKLVKELDYGGVSRQEFRDIITELERDHKISNVDARNLRKLL